MSTSSQSPPVHHRLKILLSIFSHAHSPPLHPPAHLKFDLRNVPNPPKDVRDRCTGRDKRLREFLVREEEFSRMLERAEGDVRAWVAKVEDVEVIRDGKEKLEDEDDSDARDHEQELDNDDEADVLEVRISCFCARGKHRSVAFVEELAKRNWPREWDVEVRHRELNRKEGRGKGREKAKGKWKGVAEEDE